VIAEATVLPAEIPYPTIAVSKLALCEGNAKKPVYAMHKWWARRLGVVFRMLLLSQAGRDPDTEADLWDRFYSAATVPEGYTVLDPFLGGGTSLIEAAKLGAHCIGCDIDPVACFVTQMELEPADPRLIRQRFDEIQAVLLKAIRPLYRSYVSRKPVDVIYYFWVDSLSCPDCGITCDGHPTYQLAHRRAYNWQTVVCPACGQISDVRLDACFLTCLSCRQRTDLRQPPVRFGKYHCPNCFGQHRIYSLYQRGLATPRLFAKEYLCADGERGFAPVTPRDVQLYQEAEHLLRQQESNLPLPVAPIPSKGRSDARPLLYGYRRYRDLFNARQLYCLGLIGSKIQQTKDPAVRRALALAFSHCLASNNMFCGYAFGYGRLTPLFSVHAYRKISRPVEGNVWGIELGRGSFSNAVRAVIAGSKYMRDPFEYRYRANGKPTRVSIASSRNESEEAPPSPAASVKIFNQTSENLTNIPTRSINLILSDPPYYDNISYSELSDFYHVWLRELLGTDYPGHDRAHTPLAEALFAGRRRHDSSEREAKRRYTSTLSRVLAECYRVAKSSATLAFTYHHRSTAAWACLGRCLLRSGFRVSQVFPVRSEGRSGLHSYEGTIKWDSVFLCHKASQTPAMQPSPQLIAGIARRSAQVAHAWRLRIRGSRLPFNLADESSLAMSQVVHAFSRRHLKADHLESALLKALSRCEAGLQT
jgi:putative DNA methylase